MNNETKHTTAKGEIVQKSKKIGYIQKFFKVFQGQNYVVSVTLSKYKILKLKNYLLQQEVKLEHSTDFRDRLQTYIKI